MMGDLRSWMEQWAEMEARENGEPTGTQVDGAGLQGSQVGQSMQNDDAAIPPSPPNPEPVQMQSTVPAAPAPRRLHFKAPEPEVSKSVEPEPVMVEAEKVAEVAVEPKAIEPAREERPVEAEKVAEVTGTVKDVPDMEEMFRRSGTEEKFRERWYAIMEKARHSKSSTFVTRKVLAGRFRVTESEMEILPDMDVYGMSSKRILTSQWNV